MADGFVSLLLIFITLSLHSGTGARLANSAKGNVAEQENQGVPSLQGLNERKHQNKLEYDDGYFGPNHQSPYYNYKGNFEVPWNRKNFKHKINSGYERMKKIRKDVLSKVLNKNRVLRIPPRKKHLDDVQVRKRRQVLQAYLIRDGGKALAASNNNIMFHINERHRRAHIIWPDLPSEYDEIGSDRAYSVGSLEQWFNYPLTTPSHPNPAWHLPTLCREYAKNYHKNVRVKRAARVGIKERRKKREKKKRDKKKRKAKKKIEKIKKMAKKKKRKKKKGGKVGKPKSPKPTIMQPTKATRDISFPDSDWTQVKTEEEDCSCYSEEYEEDEEITNELDEYEDEIANNDTNKKANNQNNVDNNHKKIQHRKVDNRPHTISKNIHLDK